MSPDDYLKEPPKDLIIAAYKGYGSGYNWHVCLHSNSKHWDRGGTLEDAVAALKRAYPEADKLLILIA